MQLAALREDDAHALDGGKTLALTATYLQVNLKSWRFAVLK